MAGVGGLVGINRSANTDLLRDRLASGAAGNVLFNENPAANAPALVRDLAAFFPDTEGIFLIGPTLKITWGVTLVSLDLGLFIELPGPRKVFLAGSLRVLVGVDPDAALVFLRMDFIGGVDITKSLIFFDAALVGSHVLQIFRLTGGAALRINYGSNGFFLLTIGGFHPSFNPGPLNMPPIARVGAEVSLNVGVRVWLKIEGYFAVTPNTLQLGAGVEAGLEIGPLQAHGWYRFDALVQFTPFHFEASIDAGFDVEVGGVSLCGVRIEGQMSGPGPIVISARGSVKILFVRISGDVTVKLGSDASDGRPQAIPDVLNQVIRRLSDPQNASVAGRGEDRSVVVRPAAGDVALKLVSPAGDIVWDQRVVPLNRDLDRFEGVPLTATTMLTVEADGTPLPVKGWFSAGTYANQSASDALNTARFCEEQSGVQVSPAGTVLGQTGEPDVGIDLHKIIDVGHRILIGQGLEHSTSWVGLGSIRNERRGFVSLEASSEAKFPRPQVNAERWRVVKRGQAATDDGSAGVSPVQAWSAARRGGVAVHAADTRISLAGIVG